MVRFRVPLIPFLAGMMCWAHADAARVIELYDTDSLSSLARLVVRAEVGQGTEHQTRDGDCTVHEIKVLTTFKGEAEPDEILRVAGLESYRKGPGLDGEDRSLSPIERGDIVYLFLVPKDMPIGYAMYRLVDADWKIIESGVRLAADDRVYTFFQYFPPRVNLGPVAGLVTMTEQLAPEAPVKSVEEFERHLAHSIQFVADLERKRDDGTLSETEREAILGDRPRVLKAERASRDHIRRLLIEHSVPLSERAKRIRENAQRQQKK